jgi:UrcA family protein
MIIRTAIAAAAFAGLAFAAQPAFATEGTFTPVSKEVRFGDLDLSTPQGQSALDARLRRAASDVCAVNMGTHPLAEEIQARRCYRKALDSARRNYAALQAPKAFSR